MQVPFQTPSPVPVPARSVSAQLNPSLYSAGEEHWMADADADDDTAAAPHSPSSFSTTTCHATHPPTHRGASVLLFIYLYPSVFSVCGWGTIGK